MVVRFSGPVSIAVPENRSARGNMAPTAKAFHHQRPQAIAATGFPQQRPQAIAATGFPQTSGYRPLQPQASTTRTCTQMSGRSHGPRCNAAFQQSNKEISNIWRSSSSSTSSPFTGIFAQDGHRPCTPADQEPVCCLCYCFPNLLASMIT